MKIAIHKSVLSLGTALAVALTPVAAPVLSPVALAQTASTTASTTTTTSTSTSPQVPEPAYPNNRALKVTDFNLWLEEKADYDAKYKEVSDLDGTVTSTTAQDAVDSAKQALGYAKRSLDTAGYLINTPKGNYTSESTEYTDLRSANDSLNTAGNKLADAGSWIRKAERGDTFVCPGAVNADQYKNGQTDNSGSSGFSLSGITSFFNSSANRIVYEGGKRQCISNSEYITKRLTAIGAVLGVIFTVISNVTKIQGIVNTLVPGAKTTAN